MKFSHVTAVLICGLFLPFSASASKRHNHKAHEHGSGKLDLAVEGSRVFIELKVPSESLYGFEHEAKSDAEIKKRDEAVEKLRTQAASMILFNPELGCDITVNTIDPFVTEKNAKESGKGNSHDHDHGHKKGKNAKSGEHSEVHASWTANCAKPPAGSVVNFGFSKAFPGLKKLKVQSVGADKQGGVTVTGDKGHLQL